MNRRLIFGTMLAGACFASAGLAQMTYTLGTPRPATVRNSTSLQDNAWLAANPVFVATAGFTTTNCVSISTAIGQNRYQLTEAESGFSWERSRPEYWLSDRLEAPEDTDWNATYALYASMEAQGRDSVRGFLFNRDATDPCVYVVNGGSQRFSWVLTDGSTNEMTYVVGQNCQGKPRRIFWTDSPYNAPPVSLQGKFVRFFGSDTILGLTYGVETNIVGGVTTVVSNKVASGLYVDPESQTLYAAGRLSGQVLMAYYDTGNYENILAVQAVEVCRPEVTPLTGVIGTALKPTGTGYGVEGLSANVTSGVGLNDVRGDYLYQHAGSYSYSPKNGDVFPIRPTEGERWNAEVYWMETDPMGVQWPFEVDQYNSDWPADGVVFVRGDVKDDAGNVDYGANINIPTVYSATLSKYQEPEGHALAVEGDNSFKTKGAGWSLLRLEANDNIWFLPIHSVLRSDESFYTLEPGRINVGQELRVRGGKSAGLVGEQLFFADDSIPGYLYKAASGTQYATNLYYEVTARTKEMDAGSTSTNALPSALYAVSEGPKDLEVWWSEPALVDGDMPEAIPVPTLPQVYHPVWPDVDEAPQIVLASQEGSANVTRFAHGSAIQFDNGAAYVQLPSRRFFPSAAGTIMFWTRPATEANADMTGVNPRVDLVSLGTGPYFDNTPSLLIYLDGTGNIAVDIDGEPAMSAPMPEVARPNDWTHVAFSFDHGESTLYIDGEEVATASTTVPTGIGEYLQGNALGNTVFDGDFSTPATRNIAEVMFFSRRMDEAAIEKERFSVHTGSEAGLTCCISVDASQDVGSVVQYLYSNISYIFDRVGGDELVAIEIQLVSPGAPIKAGSVIASDKTPEVYYQNNPSADGYNPNEEHAFVRGGGGGYVTWALRTDLNTADTPPPGAFVTYEKDGKAKLQFYHVVLTNETWSALGATCKAGLALPGPHPIDTFDDPWLPEDYWEKGSGATGPAYRDRKGQIWARAAGTLPIHMYYRMQDGFWFPQIDAGLQPAVGTPLPWLSLLDKSEGQNRDPLTAAPAAWTWNVEWPENVPTLKIGQTLTVAEKGLPEVWNAKSLSVIFPDPETADKTVILTDPTVERGTAFADGENIIKTLGLSVDKDGGLYYRGGKYFFTDLPPSISSRFYLDTTKHELCIKGERSSSAAGVNILYPNVISASERQLILDLIPSDVRASHSTEYGWFAEAVRALAVDPIEPTAVSRNGTEISSVYAPVDHYALTAMGATNYVVLIENDATNFVSEVNGVKKITKGVDAGNPVNMRVMRVEPDYYLGRVVTREDSVNLLSQQLSVIYAEQFAGKADDFVFEWRCASPNANGTIPDDYDNTQIYAPRYNAATNTPEAIGTTKIVIGGQGDTLANMVNKYWICRYRAKDANSPSYETMGLEWSDWCAPPALAEGWVQRVLNNITPFTQRMTDLYENPVETPVTMIQQAGAPFQGDVALNQDNLTSVGLIQLYETLLNKAESMSLMLGDNNADANKQLLLAVERLYDLYTVLGDEAYSDAKNPTIGLGMNMSHTDNQPGVEFCADSSALFCFDNQVPTLLDEELALLRGRSGESAPSTQLPPYYNRLVWNFTRGITAGEVAYAVNYGIEGRESVTLGEEQAATLFPQGHGDAYGHYLSALKGWYRLLRNPNFSWGIPAQGELVVADAAVNADYYEEAKFAEAAANLAKTAADCVDMTARKAWRDNGTSGSGYLDEDADRAFGYGEWASRGAYGALVNWVVANSLLPEDANLLDEERSAALFSDGALTRIDRGTVGELADICTYAKTIQSAEDRLDAGMNPLGLSDRAIPFDITPIGDGDDASTHYEQIRDRAVTALANARTVLDRAQDYGCRLRLLQESADSYEQAICEEEEELNTELVSIYGSPYTDDIGPSGTYPQDYEGPDLIHYNWMDLSKFGLTDVEDTIEKEVVRYKDLGDYHAKWYESLWALGGDITTRLEELKVSNSIAYSRSASGLILKPSYITGMRVSPGSIQEKYGDFLLQYVETKQALGTYENAISELDYQTTYATSMSWFYFGFTLVKQGMSIYKQTEDFSDAGINMALNALEYYRTLSRGTRRTITDAVPAVVGAGMTVVTSPRAFVDAANAVAENAENASVAGSKYLLKNALILESKGGIALSYMLDEFEYWADYYNHIQEIVSDVKSAANDVNSAYGELVNAVAKLNVCVDAYNAEVAKGETTLAKRENARKRYADNIAQMRYNDMFFRLQRNKALARYTASFDLAQKYVFFAAQAYDYETALLSSDPAAGEAFKAKIIGARALGSFDDDGNPIVADVGDGGLAGLLAQMDANWLVLKPRLGINNPQPYATWFSLRGECFRILPDEDGDEEWAKQLTSCWVDDIKSVPEFTRYCQPFHSQFGLQDKEPGLVIPFSTTIDFAKNLFGNDLAGDDSAYDSSWYSTRIAAAGLWFDGYNSKADGYKGKAQLATTPVAYLVPVGSDRMRVPGLDDGTILGFDVVDQTIPAPYVVGSSHLDSATWFPSLSDGDLAGADANARIRRHPSFRAYFDPSGEEEPSDDQLDCTRLVGRSVWNTKWLLIIPAGSMNADRDKALSIFINGSDENRDGELDLEPVSDIRIGFKTYSNSGN